MRCAKVERKTKETEIVMELNNINNNELFFRS